MIPDSTADKLKNADQNTDKHLMVKPAAKLRQKMEKITKEMTDLHAYRKIRTLKTNFKW